MENLILITESELRKLIREETEAVLSELNIGNKTDTYLDIAGAAEFLKLSSSTLYGLIHRRRIPFIKQGRRVLFEKKLLENWIKGENNP